MVDYVLEGPRWGVGPAGTSGGVVTWAFDSSVSSSFLPVVSAAFADWSANANITFQQTNSPASADIDFHETYIDGLDNTLGETQYADTGGGFQSADITFDNSEGWHTLGTAVVSNDSISLFLVALHEIGHAIGLDHYNDAPAVMNAMLDRRVSDLTISDLDGIHALYGTAGPTPSSSVTVPGPTSGDDNLFGTDGPDVVSLLGGNDVYYGGAGDDSVNGDDGNDLIYGNIGNDQLFGNAGRDTLYGGQGADYVRGGKDDDTLFGDRGNDIVYGDLGNDVLHGGKGDDIVYGGKGADILFGDLGNDTLIGGQGADAYVFGQSSGADLIQGFSQAEGDRLDIQGQTYSVGSAPDGSALVTLSGGGTIELAGVTHDQVSAGFFSSAQT